MDPLNGNGNGQVTPPVSAPATPAPSTAQPSISYIEEATRMLEDVDLPPDYSQDSWNEPAQQTPPVAPQQPTYPQPVVPGQPRQPAPQAAPVAPVAPQVPPQVAPQAPVAPTPAPGTPEQQAIQDRIRRDPFGVQAEILQQQEAQYIEALAQQVYPVSQEDVDSFLSGDGTRISQALARVHVNAVGSTMRVISQQMPFWINNMLQTHKRHGERENAFWERNKFLDRNKHGQIAVSTARAYRQMHPNAPDEEIDRIVGAMVAVASGIQVPPGAVTVPGATTAAPAPNAAPSPAPQYRTPGPVVRQVQRPFQPAGTSVPGAHPRPAARNQWSELSEILMADQDGRLDNAT